MYKPQKINSNNGSYSVDCHNFYYISGLGNISVLLKWKIFPIFIVGITVSLLLDES